MKNKVYFFAVCSAALLYSCSGSMNPAKLMSKKWALESVKGKMFDAAMAQMDAMKKAMDTTKDSMSKATMKASIDSYNKGMADLSKNTLTCNGDGTCQMHTVGMGQEKDLKGKWNLIDDGKKVVMTEDGNPKADTATVMELTADKMTIGLPDGQGGTMSYTYKS